jgi:hypothetical protein
MVNDDATCSGCNFPLIEIDHYGVLLIDRWSWRGSNRLFMKLPEEDLSALREIRRSGSCR